MSQPISITAAATRVTVSGGVLGSAVGVYTGITWPMLLTFVGISTVIMLIGIWKLAIGERALKRERALFHGHSTTPVEIVEDGIDWLFGNKDHDDKMPK